MLRLLSLGVSIFIHGVAYSNVLFFLDPMELVFVFWEL